MRDLAMVIVLGLSIGASWTATAEIMRARTAYESAAREVSQLLEMIREARKEAPRDGR